MTASKAATQTAMLILLPMIMLVCFIIVMKSFQGDSTLQKILAWSGFAAFAALYGAVLAAKWRGSKTKP